MIDNMLSNINCLPLVRKNANTNKGDFGSVAIIGGNCGMVGSIYLAGRAAMLMGAGKVALAPLSMQYPIDILMPELMIKPLNEVLSNLNEFSVVVVGLGLGIDKHAVDVLTEILSYQYLPTSKLIFDADALNLLANHSNLQSKFMNLLPFDKLITPHPREASRLLNMKVCDIQNNRIEAVQKLSKIYKSITLLKGSGSLICAKTDESGSTQANMFTTFINKTGNQSLSSAGQGDTLCGLIAGLAAQGVDLIVALRLGVYLHGLSADDLVLQYGGYNGILASDVALNCRKLLNKILYT